MKKQVLVGCGCVGKRLVWVCHEERCVQILELGELGCYDTLVEHCCVEVRGDGLGHSYGEADCLPSWEVGGHCLTREACCGAYRGGKGDHAASQLDMHCKEDGRCLVVACYAMGVGDVGVDKHADGARWWEGILGRQNGAVVHRSHKHYWRVVVEMRQGGMPRVLEGRCCEDFESCAGRCVHKPDRALCEVALLVVAFAGVGEGNIIEMDVVA